MTTTQVRVALRIRPLSDSDRFHNSSECIFIHPDEPTQVVLGQNRSFTFDRVFGASVAQDQVYTGEAERLVEQFLAGFNVTLMAYGQTNSGKSYSMGTSLGGNVDIDPATHGNGDR
jgi:hypothetical protein